MCRPTLTALALALVTGCMKTQPSSMIARPAVSETAVAAPTCVAPSDFAPTRDSCRAGDLRACKRLGYRLAHDPACYEADALVARVTTQCRDGNAESCGAIGALNASR